MKPRARRDDERAREAESLRELERFYADVDALYAGTSCPGSTECCRFAITGREPYVTGVELALLRRAIAQRSGKKADRAAAYLEATRLAGFSDAEALEIFGAPPPFGSDIVEYLTPWPAQIAQKRFLTQFYALDALFTPTKDT